MVACWRGPLILSLRSLALGEASCHALCTALGRVPHGREMKVSDNSPTNELGSRLSSPSNSCGPSLQLDESVM